MVLRPFENFLIPCLKNQIMGHTKIGNLKALYYFYENYGICFTSLSSSKKSANWQNAMFKFLFILNCDWEVQAFPNMILIHFDSLDIISCIDYLR